MHPLAQSLRKLSSGGARCHHDNTGLEEKRKEKKKSLPLAVLFPPATWGPLPPS